MPFRRKHKSLLVSFWVNLNRNRKAKWFLSFRRQDKSLQVFFRVNLKRKRKDKLFLSFQRKPQSLHLSHRVNLNHRLTNRKRKDKPLKLLTRCKDIEYLLHKTLPQ